MCVQSLVPSLQTPRLTHQWCRSGFVEEGEGEGEGEAEAERARRVGALPVVYICAPLSDMSG